MSAKFATTPDHVFRDRQLRDLDAKLQQFAMDATAPTVGSPSSPSNGLAQLTANSRPPLSAARFPAPIGTKSCSMPPQDRVRLDDAG